MHLFILAATNMHSFPFLHYLTDICGVNRSHIKVLFFDINSEKELQSSRYNLQGIEIYYSSEWNNPYIYQDVKNITISSLSSVKGQAEYVKNIIDSGLAAYTQLIIRITDDEVDRWTSLYKKHGKIVESKGAHVDSSTMAILQHASRFICRYKPWGQQLEIILERKLVIYNISILVNPFTDSKVSNLYESKLRVGIRQQLRDSQTIRILVHTKPSPNYIVRNILSKALLPLLINHRDLLASRTLEFFLWWPLIRDMPTFNLVISRLLLVSKLKRIKIKFNFINSMPTEVYYSLLSSMHILIAQNRGGLGAIIDASKNGSIVVMQENSYNEELYTGYKTLPFVKVHKIEDYFIDPIKLLKENDFETLLDTQQVIATEFFQNQFIESKNILLNIYS